MQYAELKAIAEAIAEMREQIPLADTSARQVMLEQLSEFRDMSGNVLDAWMEVDDAIEEAVRELTLDESAMDIPQKLSQAEISAPSVPDDTKQRDPGFDVQPLHLAEAWFDLSLKGEYLLRKGLAYFDLKMFAQAAKTLSGAVKEQDIPGARIYLALSFLASGQLNEAARHLKTARYMAKDALTLQAVLEAEVEMYSMQEDWSATVRTLYELLAYDPDLGDTWFNIGICHMHLYEFAAAERCFAQAAHYQEDEATILWRAFSLALMDSHDGSVELLATLGNTDEAEGLQELRSTVYLAVGMIDRALHHASQISRRENAAAMTALCLILNGQSDLALVQLKRHLTLCPDNRQALTLFGVCSYLTGNLTRARKSFANLKDCTPSSAFVELILARMDMASGDMAAAEYRLRSLGEDSRLSVRRLAVLYLGMLKLLCGKDVEAKESFARASQLGFRREVIDMTISKTRSMVSQV